VSLVSPKSLAATLDALNEAFFYERPLTNAERREAARWIAGRQGLPGSYAEMFAPTENDFATGMRFFTGETLPSSGGTAHVLGEEACRALILLDVKEAAVQDALRRATEGMLTRLGKERGACRGTYCCGKCSVAYWRHLAVGGLDHAERRLAAAMKALKARRQDDGRWRTYPFWYTMLALTEIALPAARRELKYAAPACERALKRRTEADPFAARRRALAERALGAC